MKSFDDIPHWIISHFSFIAYWILLVIVNILWIFVGHIILSSYLHYIPWCWPVCGSKIGYSDCHNPAPKIASEFCSCLTEAVHCVDGTYDHREHDWSTGHDWDARQNHFAYRCFWFYLIHQQSHTGWRFCIVALNCIAVLVSHPLINIRTFIMKIYIERCFWSEWHIPTEFHFKTLPPLVKPVLQGYLVQDSVKHVHFGVHTHIRPFSRSTIEACLSRLRSVNQSKALSRKLEMAGAMINHTTIVKHYRTLQYLTEMIWKYMKWYMI